MFRMMARRLRDTAPYLGIGVYYARPDTGEDPAHTGWVNVTLDAPLILNGRQARMLIEKYGTDSADNITVLAGAWTLRREIIQMGHDSIIAVGANLNDGRLTIVDLASAVPSTVQTIAGYKKWRESAQIYRIGQGELPAR